MNVPFNLKLLFILLFLPGVGSNSIAQQHTSLTASEIPYDELENWAAHPWKNDPSDSVPAALASEHRDTIADVFFIHPTTYTQRKAGWNADIQDAVLNKKTDYSTILYQASVFNQHCRIFAPRYRQAHLSAFFSKSPDAQNAFDIAYADIKNAFEYYLHFYNEGRPIIIAGHSQGAKLAELLLKEFFDGKLLQRQLVAAYIIGWPVQEHYFQSIPVCTTATQTGGFCTWRTYKAGYVPEYIKREQPQAYVTNPLSWQIGTAYVGNEMNDGSILRDFNVIVKHAADAQVHGGVLWANKPQIPGRLFFVSRNYHIADINLYYVNIRENVEQRIVHYSKTNAF